MFRTFFIQLLFALPLVAAPLDYGRDIRPILSENCFYCHGQDGNKRKADLQLNTLEGQRAEGVIVPGKPELSGLIERILSDDPDELMPPPESHRVLSKTQKEMLKRWISEGANFTSHWAFVAPQRPVLPEVKDQNVQHPLDRFIVAKLEKEGLQPSPQADKATLLRRVTLDLTGLPPTPEEVDAFESDSSPEAYEKVVDRLLMSPRYGERMALPWLDAARYADSNGFQQDGDTFQWIWRDWVVQALNADMPFDQFSIEQLAGDLLPAATLQQKIATAFNRNHMLNGEGGAIAEEQRHVILYDRVDVTSTNWLGLTMACAQCHDHKYDPMTQKDYYSLMAAFNNIPETGGVPGSSSRIRVAPPLVELKTPEYEAALKALQEELNKVIESGPADWKALRDALQTAWEDEMLASQVPEDGNWKRLAEQVREAKPDKPNTYAAGRLREEFNRNRLPKLKSHDGVKRIVAQQGKVDLYQKDDLPRVMVMQETQPRETHILSRGEYLSPLEKVSINTPAFLPPLPKDAPNNRLGLAKWLFGPENPLTARVQVNRMWQMFFGTGLVKTVEDLGVQSEVPVHQDLLDWLAVEFREKGWSMKHMHRLIVTSAAYQQSSRVTPELHLRDPENRLMARSSRFRIPAMMLRDMALATSGLLEEKLGGKPVYPYQPEGIWDTLAITKERDFSYPKSSGSDLYRRSLYTFWRRTVGPANMFDASSRQACKVTIGLTNTPLHALTTLNDPTWVEAARVMAEKLMEEQPDPKVRLTEAFRLVLARKPTEADLDRLQSLLDKQLYHFRSQPEAAVAFISTGEAPRNSKLNATEHAAWSALCLGLYNLDEVLTRN
jgi:hypothetical protein